uniref:Uncharacterized protein n=1 Tax=Anguilla anguilla TaxID=7936 RepID=A0A0E9TFG0_ANGAN
MPRSLKSPSEARQSDYVGRGTPA